MMTRAPEFVAFRSVLIFCCPPGAGGAGGPPQVPSSLEKLFFGHFVFDDVLEADFVNVVPSA